MMKFKKLFTTVIATAVSTAIVFSGCAKSTGNDSPNNKVSYESTTNSQTSQEATGTEDENITSDLSEDNSQNVLPVESTITPAAWEVTDSNGNVIYMMGSIHLADADAAVLPDYFENAYAGCDFLAVECDITDTKLGMSDYQQLLYADGTTIKDHVSAESYDKAVKILKDAKQYLSSYDYMKPIIWVDLVEIIAAKQAGLSEKYGIDSNLIKRAKKEGKEILEVESVAFQYDLLANLPEDMQSMLFDDIAEDNVIEETATQLEELYDRWKTGTMTEEDASEGTDDETLTEEQARLLEEYNQILLYDRNVGMADKAMEYMNDGKKVMFVVGAAHFYGDKGILQLMENAGCTVRRLTSEDDSSATAPEKENQTTETAASESEETTPETEITTELPEAA